MLGDIFRVFISSWFAQIFGLVRSFLLPIIMLPDQLGIWNFVNVLIGYGANSHIGLLHGFNKSFPKLSLVNNFAVRNTLRDSVFWTNIILALFFSIVIAFYIIIFTDLDKLIAYLLAISVIVQSIYIYYICLMRAESNFKLYSFIASAYSIIQTFAILSLTFLIDNKIFGALIGLIISQLLIVLILFKKTKYHFKFAIKINTVIPTIKLGAPIMVIGFLDMILLTLDRWLVIFWGDSNDLGMYAFATIFSVAISSIPLAVGQVLYPLMLRLQVSKENDAETLALIAMPIVAFFVGIICITLYLLTPYLVINYFHKYLNSIEVCKILIASSYFVALTHVSGMYLIAVDKQNKLPIIQILSITFGIFFSFLLFEKNPNITSIGYGVSLMYVIYGVGYLFLAKYNNKNTAISVIYYVLKIVLPYVLALIFITINSYYHLFYFLNEQLFMIFFAYLILLTWFIFECKSTNLFKYIAHKIQLRVSKFF